MDYDLPAMLRIAMQAGWEKTEQKNRPPPSSPAIVNQQQGENRPKNGGERHRRRNSLMNRLLESQKTKTFDRTLNR
ncbi:MAG: hypothetical protein DRQ57_15555 [Gammaproteobacteria bacterium]|nr:MAG: hypothetical protein DRQ57_15555 [Gammaproteobacteria bacterium]